jgi:putative ABC transport system ATP-binding protein
MNASVPETRTIPAPLIELRAVTKVFGSGAAAVRALASIDLTISESEFVAIMGPSGSGKSTLMHILAGLDRPNEGEVTIAGRDITGLDDTQLTKLRRAHIGFIFQFFNLLPMLTAEENVVLPLKLAGEKPDREWVGELTSKVGLSDRLSHRPSELSGGQQQRVAVARALVSRPSVMFADEPTGNLDSTTSGEILELLRDSVTTLGQTTVMVTHDAHAAAIADRVLFLADGLIVKDLGPSSAHEVIEAMEAVNGESGVQLALLHKPALVLMDIQLPDINGIEPFERIRANPDTARIPVVAFTASVTANDRSRITDAGFDGFLGKPINLKEFVETVRRFVDRPAA